MMNDDRTKVIPRRTPEAATMLASVKRVMAITANLNRLMFNDADEFRDFFSQPLGRQLFHNGGLTRTATTHGTRKVN